MTELLGSARPALAELSREVQLRVYGFGPDLVPLRMDNGAIDLSAPPNGDSSPLGWALEEILRREAGQRILAVVVLSDGAQRALPPRDSSPVAAAGELARAGIPVSAIAFGEPRGAGRLADVSVEGIRMPATAIVGNEVEVLASFHVEGYPGTRIPVELFLEDPSEAGGKILARAELEARSVSYQDQLRLNFVPEKPGEWKIVVRVPNQPGEAIPQNNQWAGILRVGKGGVRVLVMESFPPRPELAFVRRALTRGPELQVEVVTVDPARPEAMQSELGEILRTREYQVYWIGNLPASSLGDTALETLKEKVTAGAGLIMVGGLWSFGPGGYAGTPLAEVLPVRMGHLEIQRPDEPPRTDVHIDGPIQLRCTPQGTSHPALAAAEIGEGLAADLWSRLPPLEGINKFEGLKPAAQVLLESTGGHPVLVYQPAGSGRVVAMAADSTWRWALGGYREFFDRFWRQLTTFVAKREVLPEGELWIELPQREWEPQQPVHFVVRHSLPPEKQGVTVSARIVPWGTSGSEAASDAQTVPLQEAEGTNGWEGQFTTPGQAGDYCLEVVAADGSANPPRARARFLVYKQDLEFQRPGADVAVLQRVAATTGGLFARPAEFPRVLAWLQQQSRQLEMTLEVKQPLWDRWPWLLLICALGGTEWYLRRRWGLV
jgi:hypothetical protein